MNKSETLLLGVALGAGLTYFLDRDTGSRRRALARDKVVRAGHELEEAAVANARHARNRAAGLLHEARAGLTERHVDDRIVEERVRSEIGRKVAGSPDLDIVAQNGRVTLSGSVPADSVQDVVRVVKSVRGVNAVENQLNSDTRAEANQGADVS